MTREGRKSEQALLEVVRESPGKSIYELAGVLNWTIGRVHGTAKRLFNSNKIYMKPIVRNGRRANLVYPEKPDCHFQ
jgi:predicted transcriptional regulator